MATILGKWKTFFGKQNVARIASSVRTVIRFVT